MTPWTSELRALLRLAGPVVTVQLGMYAMNLVDTVMVGHLGGEGSGGALAAVGLGAQYHFTSLCFFLGSLLAIDPVIAQGVGAKDEPAVARGIQRGLVLAAAMSIPVALFAIPAPSFLRALGQPEEVIPAAASYARINALGIFPFLAFTILRQALQALDRTVGLLVTIVAANLLNVVANWVLIYGHCGAPALGTDGSAWATVFSRWTLFLVLAAREWRILAPHLRPFRPEVFTLAPYWRLLRIGAPIGLQYFFEIGIFYAALLMIGALDPARNPVLQQEAHQVALSLASISFMVPLGISSAASVRVGRAVGRGDEAGARLSAGVAIGVGVLVMAGFGGLFLSAPAALASVYSDRTAVIALAATLIPLAGLFQVFDGLQVVSLGVLRGLGDTTIPAAITILGYWGLGLPVGAWLCFREGLEARGVWWAFVCALAAVGLLLLLRVRIRFRRDLHRIVIDHAPAVAAPGADAVP